MNNQPKIYEGEHGVIYSPHDRISVGSFEPVLVPVFRGGDDSKALIKLNASPLWQKFKRESSPVLCNNNGAWLIQKRPYGRETTLEYVTKLSWDERQARLAFHTKAQLKAFGFNEDFLKILKIA